MNEQKPIRTEGVAEIKMELVKNNAIEILSRRSVAIKDYSIENGEEEEEEQLDEGDRTSLKIDLSMAEQFYYEVISSFEQEEVDIFIHALTLL